MKKLLFSLFLISVFAIAGCGGGGSSPKITGVSGRILLGDSVTNQTFRSFSRPINFKKQRLFTARRTTAPIKEKIVRFRQNLSTAERTALLQKIGGKIKKKLYGPGETYVVTISENKLSSLAWQNLDGIESLADNSRVYAMALPNDEFYPAQAWHYGMMDLPAAWDIFTGGNEIVVAIIDTGIAPNHPDLAGRLVASSLMKDFYDDDNLPWDDVFGGNDDYQWSHGTHVAGTIGAQTNNGVGVAGIAWNVKLMPLRILGPNGEGSTASLIEAIRWAVDKGAHIINLSLGAPASEISQQEEAILQEAVDYAMENNVTIVAAAGNEAGEVSYPARLADCIAVSALGSTKQLASYSNFGPEVDFAAPGGDSEDASFVLSTGYNLKTNENGYVGMNGTSMATPHIAGLAALLYARGYSTPPAVKNRLQAACEDLGVPGKDNYYGYGLPFATAALFDFNKIIVYVGNEDGTPLSTPVNVAKNGTYTIKSLEPGPVRICAWLDKNNNSNRDTGDLFGYIDVTIEKDTVLDRNITLTSL